MGNPKKKKQKRVREKKQILVVSIPKYTFSMHVPYSMLWVFIKVADNLSWDRSRSMYVGVDVRVPIRQCFLFIIATDIEQYSHRKEESYISQSCKEIYLKK